MSSYSDPALTNPTCYDDKGNLRRCPDFLEHHTPNGTCHPGLKPSAFYVWDGRMGIEVSSIRKNGHHCWQINVNPGNKVSTMGGNAESYVSPFSNEAYTAELRREAQIERGAETSDE